MNIEFTKYQESTITETLDINVESIAKAFVESQLEAVFEWLVDDAGYSKDVPAFSEDEYPDPSECYESVADAVVKYIKDNWLNEKVDRGHRV